MRHKYRSAADNLARMRGPLIGVEEAGGLLGAATFSSSVVP